MSNLKNVQYLLERLQDECPEVDDLSLKRILETIESEGVSVGKKSRLSKCSEGPPKESICDRAQAVSALRLLDASRDSEVDMIRCLDKGLREKVFFSIFQRAKVSGTFKEPPKLRSDACFVMRLPGMVLERPDESLFLPLSSFQDIDPVIASFLTRLTLIAARISDDYCIDPDYSLIFLLLDIGYRSKPQVDWSIASREDRPGLTRINMSIDPWSSPEEVAAEYAMARIESGHAFKRAQRARTYLLAERFATYSLVGLIDPKRPDWRLMINYWSLFCEDNGLFDWSYFVKGRNRDQDVYQFSRDVRHALATLRDAAKPRRSKAKKS